MPKRRPTNRVETGPRFDVWLYFDGAGWWLQETTDTVGEATECVRKSIRAGACVGGAVLPEGQPLGLFTRRMEVPK